MSEDKNGNIIKDGVSYTKSDYAKKLKRDKKRAEESKKILDKKLKKIKSHQQNVGENIIKK